MRKTRDVQKTGLCRPHIWIALLSRPVNAAIMNAPNGLILLSFTALLLAACSKTRSANDGLAGTGGRETEPKAQILPEVFFSSENPGQWKERAPEHDMLIREGKIHYSGKTRLRELIVTVPLQGDARHYLEAGLVMDHSLKKELDKVSFKSASPKYDFSLNVPADSPNAVFVVIKCNQHDMWMKRVEPLPQPR